MTGRLEQALRLKSHGFFFLVGIGRGSRCDGSGGRSPTGVGGAAPRLGAPSRARRGPLFRWSKAPVFGAVLGCSPYLDTIGCNFDRSSSFF